MLGIAGVIILLLTVYLLVKQYETRMVLFMSGLVMTLIAMDPMAAFKGFSAALKGAVVIETITASMAFAFVMEYTKCDKHLVHLLAKGLKKVGPALIPGAVLVTAFVHISVPSAAGCVAAVGSVLIPILIGAGVHPAMAASTVFAGTFGATHLHPGFHQNVIIANAVKNTPVEVVANHFYPVLIIGVVVALGVTVVAVLLKEHKGYQQEVEVADFEVNFIRAMVPLVPLVLILLGSMKIVPALKVLGISHAMIIGTMVACVITRTTPGEISNAFFNGMGRGFSFIYGIIICSTVFVAGLTATGLLKSMLDFMSSHPASAKLTGSFGPFLLGVICGSGDAASVAFNNAVTPFAASFGIDALNLGSSAAIGGAIGRTMSPIAGAAMVCCGLAGVKNPMELAKRNALPMLAAVITMSVLLLFMR
jgi:DcuC family C4-dicarboxylate transporter